MRLRKNALIALALCGSMVTSMAAPAYAADIWAEAKTEVTAAEEERVDETQLSPWLITEVVTDSISGEKYTYCEIYNNSDQELDFADYTLFYDYPTGGGYVFSRNAKTVYTYKKKYTSSAFYSAADNTQLTSIKVGSGETLILWYNNNLSTTSLAEFKAYYGMKDDVNIIRLNHGGIHSSQKRGYRIGKDSDSIITEAYSDEHGNMIADGTDKQAYQFTYPTTGMKCEQMSIAAATPGEVTEGQVPSKRVTVKETQLEIDSVTAAGDGDFIVTAKIPYEGTSGAMAVNLTYNQTAETSDGVTSGNTTLRMVSNGDGETFVGTVPADKLFGTSAEYYVTASFGGSNKDVSEKTTVKINREEASAENGAPLVITEIAPSSKEEGMERYDFFELYNRSDETINLGYWKIFYYYNYPAQTASQNGKVWTIGDFTETIAPGQAKVVWLNNKGLTVDDFNNFYGTDLVQGEDIVEINYSGLHDTDPRWFRIGTTEENAFTIAAFNEDEWQTTTSGKSLHYAVPNDASGVNESIPAAVTKSTPGSTAGWQTSENEVKFNGYPDYPENDGKEPTLKVCTESGYTIPESINEGEELQVMYDVDLLNGFAGARTDAFKDYIDETNPMNHPGGSEALKTRPYLMGTEIYYKLDNEKEWTVVKEQKQWRLGHYFMKIPSGELYGHDSVTYKVRAYSLYGYNETSEVTVKINGLNDTKGKVRLNVQDGSVISGQTTITANDGADNAGTVIRVDGNTQEQTNVFENGAYFSLKTSGVDSYFKNGVTAPYGNDSRELITIIYNWCEATNYRVIKIDNKYFTYNPETDSYDVTITLWAGSSGTPFEEIYEYVSAENHEDYSVTALQMKLANGKTYLPVKIEPDNEKTNTSTELSASHTIGDSAGMETHLDATFSIPAADAEAVGIALDTTTLTDGEHTITATAGEKTTTANVIVDNTAPEIAFDIAQDAVLYDTVVLEEGSIATDANGISEAAVSLDDEILELPTAIVPGELKAGEHTIKVVVTDAAGNVAAKEVHFKTEDTDPAVTDVDNDGIADKQAILTVNVGPEAADVTFFEGKSLTEENGGIIKGESGESKNGSVPYQLFRVNAGEVEDTDNISIHWTGTSGNADASHPLTMFVRNTGTNEWETVKTADDDGKIEATIGVKDHVKDGAATILVQTIAEGDEPAVKANRKTAEAAAAAENTQSDWDGSSRPENYDFALAWETDTQYYAESFPYHYTNMNQWIADNAEEWKIKYVFHTGDIVDDCDMAGEWVNADKAMKILDDANIPYGVLGGNHDVFAGAENYGNYWKYFGADRFADKNYYGGTYKNNLGHYDLISADGQDFIMIYMSWDIYTEELEWMNEILRKYPDRKAILAFHRYIGVGAGEQKLDYTGKLIQNEVVAKNSNVMAVIDGHYHGASLQTDAFDDDGDGVAERTVYQICTDYQSDPEGGSEYIKFFYFDLANDKIYVNSYSPYRDDFNYYDSPKMESYAAGARATNQDIAELDVDFDTSEKTLTTTAIHADVRTKTKIGTVKEASGTVNYTWSGLSSDTEYSWYAKVTNGRNGVTYTGVRSFRTEREAGAYTVTATAGQGGYISNAGETRIAKGGNLTYMVSAKEGYRISKIYVDGVEVKLTDNQYTLTDINADYSIEAEFELTETAIVTPDNGDEEGTIPETGSVSAQAGIYYKVLTASANGGTVAAAGIANKELAAVRIPSTVKINGLTYKVTEISDRAFAGNRTIKKVTVSSKYLSRIGDRAFSRCTALKEVTVSSKKLKTIGRSAFQGDKKLSKITLKTTKLKNANVGKQAFKGIKKTCKIKVPAKKVKAYKIIFKAKGAGAKVKVTKQ